MPTGTPKGYEEENRLQRQEDEKQIKRLLKRRNWEPEWETWNMVQNERIEYAKAIAREAPKEELAEIGRRLNTAKALYNEIGGYTCQMEEAKERLREILKEMKAEDLPAKWAVRRIRNREMREAGYKFNGKTRQ